MLPLDKLDKLKEMFSKPSCFFDSLEKFLRNITEFADKRLFAPL